jgi:ATP-dependent DNA helicase RecG
MNKLPQKENVSVEFKTSFNEEAIESLVAFSNAKGGTVYLGVSDNGKIHGLTIGKETISSLINEIKCKTTPQIIPDVDILTIDNKKIIALFVPEYPIKPVSTRGKYFKRMSSSNHLLSIDEIANEHLKTINSSWDFYIDSNHSEADLSKEKISKFIKKVKQNDGITRLGLSNTDILTKMEILREGKVTFGAYLLFAKDYCSISDVQIGRFKSDITIIDSISLNTDLFREIDEIMVFIKKHLKVEYIITGEPQRTERFDYPMDAIREIVVNMIVHRDYRDSSASIIKIFDNRIEFYNPGKLYGGITIQNLLSGNYTSKSRNKLIARAFKDAGMIERYGSGIMRIRKICKEYGIKEPVFNEVFDGFQVILYNEKIMDKVINITDVQKNIKRKRKNDLENDLENRHGTIIKFIKSNTKVSMLKLSKVLNVSPATIKRDIEQLKMNGLIERVGANKGGYWKILK